MSEEFLTEVRALLDDGGIEVGFFWPAGIGRGRLHAHVVDYSGIHQAFAKLSLDRPNDVKILKESYTLAWVASGRGNHR